MSISQGLMNRIFPLYYSATLKILTSVWTITEIFIFPGLLPFFNNIFQNCLKFHDISITGKSTVIFPGFQGVVGTLFLNGFRHFQIPCIFTKFLKFSVFSYVQPNSQFSLCHDHSVQAASLKHLPFVLTHPTRLCQLQTKLLHFLSI